jgi:hypothetical protein
MEPESKDGKALNERSMTIQMPDELYNMLVASSMRSERSLAAEVRFRLRRSFQPNGNGPTGEP